MLATTRTNTAKNSFGLYSEMASPEHMAEIDKLVANIKEGLSSTQWCVRIPRLRSKASETIVTLKDGTKATDSEVKDIMVRLELMCMTSPDTLRALVKHALTPNMKFSDLHKTRAHAWKMGTTSDPTPLQSSRFLHKLDALLAGAASLSLITAAPVPTTSLCDQAKERLKFTINPLVKNVIHSAVKLENGLIILSNPEWA